LAILAVLAGAAAVAAQTPPASTVSPVTVHPPSPTAPPVATVHAPSDSTAMGAWASVWPAGAFEARLRGHVILTCGIDRYGLAEWCKVASETPANKGFGAAALELRPTFKVTPPAGAGDQALVAVNIAVEFKPPDTQIDWGDEGASPTLPASRETENITIFGGPPLVRRPVAMLNNPVWASTISHADLAKAYPVRAGGVEGYAVAHCEVERDGSVSGCQLTKEEPKGRGFGPAALRLAAKFKVAPQWTIAPNHADVWVDIPIRFPASGGAAADRVVASPYWVSGFSPAQALKVYPPEAAANDVATGYGLAKCVVTADGGLAECAPERADPDGLGFSEAAARLAATMRMNPWTLDGSPVDGDVVEVGVRLNLKPES
jgi:TonB family protein